MQVSDTTPNPLPTAAAGWRDMILPYTKPQTWRALMQLLNTGLPFFAVMLVITLALHHGILAAVILFPAGAVLLVRLFMLQHDCGHGSFFPAAWANHLLGWVLGVFTLTPYTSWRREHAIHHASMGNLDRRGVGDVTTLTIAEYQALPKWRRLGYRLYRHPLVMFGLGPIWLFFLSNRIPTGNPLRQWRNWVSILSTNTALAIIFVTMLLTLGPVAILLGWLPVTVLAATIGVWLFYIQHQFENVYWESRPNWDFRAAALTGSSFYDLPQPLRWFTANIGFHHIHHLSSKIPNYRLRKCHVENPALQAAPRLTLLGSLKCARLALWDTELKKLVPFSALATG
jgi:omega-6 fatty acid desaturase (delta-12 desaturase)